MRRRLGVNVDHVATLRQARGTRYPDPVAAALAVEAAGADQITVHLREDRRHIQERDVRVLRDVVQTALNLEMAATADGRGVALAVRPDVVTLVPERREELTTEGGLDVVQGRPQLQPLVATLRDAGLVVSLFVDPDAAQLDAAHALGATTVELHTGTYCDAAAGADRAFELQRLVAAALAARERGLEVACGHGLTTRNVGPLVAVDAIAEYNIGHSLVADAVLVGLPAAVATMLRCLTPGLGRPVP